MSDGFEKITPSRPMPRRYKVKLKKPTIIVACVVGFLLLFTIFGIVLPVTSAMKSAKKAYASSKLVLTSLKQQNIALASDQISAAKADIAQTQKDVHAMVYLQFIPFTTWYYSDVNHLLNAGSSALQAGEILIDSIKPYADVLGFKGGTSFTGGSAQDRIALAVRTMDKITPRIDDIGQYLVAAQHEIDQVDPNHYPSILGGKKVHDQLVQVKTFTDEGVTFITQAKPLVKVLPSLLGEPKEKKYLVIFQNDKELRPTGGFMTAYAIFRVEHGVIKVDKSEDIYTLDSTVPNKPSAPRPIALYLPSVPQWNLRDTNLSPDFNKSMQDFNKLYQTAGGYQKVDAIVAIDTHVLVSAMTILGDMQVDGLTMTTKTDPRCNCAQVIYEIESYADKPVGFVRSDRKGIIGDLMYAIMSKAFSSSPKQYWGPLFQTLIAETNQKHILFDVYNDDAQKALESLNAGGRIMDFSGDYLHINQANLGGAKSNMYITQAVKQNYEVKSDGSIIKTLTIDYKNPYPPSDCNLEYGNLCLNAILRNWFRVYVPKGSELIDSKGSEV